MDKLHEHIKTFFKSRNLKYGSNSIILIAAVVAIAVILNMFMGMVDVKLDLTPEKLYSIGDASKDILNGLNKDITIYGLFDDGQVGATEYKEVVEILGRYEQYKHINVEYIDSDKNPGIIKELDPDGIMGLAKTNLVVVCGDKKKKLERYDLFRTEYDQNSFQPYITGSTAEQGITGAIKYVSADVTPTIYFLQGHDEVSIDGEYGQITTALTQNNYDVKTLNLISEEKVPDDCTVLVVASPKKDLSVDEKRRLDEYMENGGKAMFLFDSLSDDPSFERFDEFFSKYNLALGHDKVKENDSSRHIPSAPYYIVPYAQSNSINGEIGTDNFYMIMPNSRSVKILKNFKDWIAATPLLKTSSAAVGEQISGGEAVPGPLDIGVAVEYTGGMNRERIVVVGNSAFISDGAMSSFNSNGFYFFMYSMFWLEDRQDEAVVAPKMYQNPTLEINQMQVNVMGVVVVIVLPLIILLAGLFVYLRRRHL